MSSALSLAASADVHGGLSARPSRAGRAGSSSQQQQQQQQGRLQSPSRRRTTRGSSNAAATAAGSFPFPNFDLGNGLESFIAPLPSSLADGSSAKSPPPRMKLMSLHRKNSASQEHGASLDLSKSMAENEAGGAYTASGACGRPGGTTPVFSGERFGHARTSSSVSHASVATDSSARLLGQQFVHPMRQTPQSFTPPVARSLQASRAGSDDGEAGPLSPASSTSPFALSHAATSPIMSPPMGPPMGTRRRPSVHAGPGPHSHSGSQTTIHLAGTPSSGRFFPEVFSPDSAPQTARTSFDSLMFSRKRSHPSLRHFNMDDPVSYDQAAQELSRELFARQRARDEKIAQREARMRERAAAKAVRKDTTIGRERSKSAEKSSSRHDPSAPHVYEQDEKVPYSPVEAVTIERVAGPTEKRPGIKRATKAASNQWSSSGFRLKTIWIKIMRALGLRSRK